METGTEGNGTLLGVDLAVTKNRVGVGGDDDVDGLDGSAEGLIKVLLLDLELEKGSVDLVDDKDGLDSLSEGLTEDGLGLDTDTLDTVDNDKRTVGNTESGGNLGREIDVTWRVDQVDQELVSVSLLLDVGDILLGQGEVHGDGSRLDGNTTVNLVLTGRLVGFVKFETNTHRVSVNRMSPALEPAIIPALETSESVRVDLPWSTWAITDMLRMLVGRSMRPRISSMVKLGSVIAPYLERVGEMQSG